jgi:hypothetical protein
MVHALDVAARHCLFEIFASPTTDIAWPTLPSSAEQKTSWLIFVSRNFTKRRHTRCGSKVCGGGALHTLHSKSSALADGETNRISEDTAVMERLDKRRSTSSSRYTRRNVKAVRQRSICFE